MKKLIAAFVFVLFAGAVSGQATPHDLQFNALAKQWDEAIPLGNGVLGALVWQRADKLRFSLDRADLWDLRPMKGLHREEFSYQWVMGQIDKKDYRLVQKYFDVPYDAEPAPSKIPGGALEFDTRDWGKVSSVHLYLPTAVCEVKWANGAVLKTFVSAAKPVGWFRFENLKTEFIPQLIAPSYQSTAAKSTSNTGVDAGDLSRLGYPQGAITRTGNSITYQQAGWGGFTYQINVQWKKVDATTIEGTWCITSQYPNKKREPVASVVLAQAMARGYAADYAHHSAWWKGFWSKSALHVPDALLEKQWYLEQYKFGSTSRPGAPPISLQAIWTADDGHLPPWKGDFHNDLNTQLSYWPAYSANHLDEGMFFLDFLDQNKANYKRYTKLYFKKDGLAVPGVTTLDGTEMGGWIQYSLSPTVACWLAQHYYLQWRYSMDKDFLRTRAYPWIKDVAIFIENITLIDAGGHRKLLHSSSPEINDNDISAWFPQNTNYDLGLMKFTFKVAAELAGEQGLQDEQAHWNKILSQYDDYALSANNELMFAPTMAYNQSHRHFSNMLAIHPLGLINWEDGPKAQTIIKNSVHLLDSIGPALWCGYSYAWLANIKARAKDGLGAAKALSIFAKAFCSVNSFHLNGDQTRSGYSRFTYRPFTLEGNFAFAAGLQEMLLQSYAGYIHVFPAIPSNWKNVSFEDLRAEGAFLVSATKKGEGVDEIKIVSEKGGVAKLKLPFKSWTAGKKKDIEIISTDNDFVSLKCKPGGVIVLRNINKL